MSEPGKNEQPGSQRIWEVDAVRGFLILCVIVSHSLFYLSYLHRDFIIPPLVRFVMQYGGALFIILSGLSATLGKRSFRRGLFVFLGGMLLTVGSYAAVLMGILDQGMIIRFGVLHLLGFVMMLYPILKKLPSVILFVFGAVVLAVGYWLTISGLRVETHLLFPLGLPYHNFASGDYFPIAPHLGWFCMGIVLGRRLYGQRRTLFPRVRTNHPVIRFLCFCGRNSLYIFILHLPILGAVLMLL